MKNPELIIYKPLDDVFLIHYNNAFPLDKSLFGYVLDFSIKIALNTILSQTSNRNEVLKHVLIQFNSYSNKTSTSNFQTMI
jgi:hypothetical protein